MSVDLEDARHGSACLKRIRKVGYRAWLAEEHESLSREDYGWERFIDNEVARVAEIPEPTTHRAQPPPLELDLSTTSEVPTDEESVAPEEDIPF